MRLLRRRIRENACRDHWSMIFAFNNLPVVAVVLVLRGHVKSDLECLNEIYSMLVTDSSCYVKCVDCSDNEGSYLYYDMICQVFVRSGTLAGRVFVEKGNDHIRGAKERRPLSAFYRFYPSKHS